MGIFSGNKEKGKLVLVFDIGSSSVGGSLLLIRKSGVPKILMTLREPIILQNILDLDKFLFSTAKSLEVVAMKIHTAGIGAPEEIFCVLSSLWHFSQIRFIKLKKNTPFTFTSKFALDLIQKEIDFLKEEYSGKSLDIKNSVRAIEFKTLKIMLNDYETPNPLNLKAKDLEMAVFISISAEQILSKIEETIGKHFHFKDIRFSPFKLASFTVVRDTYVNQEDFLLIDIDGEVTDISMVKKDILREAISFPLGLNFFIRGVASEFNTSLVEAKSLISLLKDGHAVESVAKKLDFVMNNLKMKWLAEFQNSLFNLSNDIYIPSTIYLVVEKEMADFFSTIIKNEQFNQYTFTESEFKVVFLNAEAFQGMVEFKENTIRDSALVIDAIYVNRFLIDPTLWGTV